MRIRQSCLPGRGISNLLFAEKVKIKVDYFIKQQKQGSLLSTRLHRHSYRLPGIRDEEHLGVFNAFFRSASRDTKAGTKVDGKKLHSSVYGLD